MKSKFPNRIKVLLKNNEIPNIVTTVPAPNSINPMRLSPVRKMFGTTDEEGSLRRCCGLLRSS